MPKSNAQLLAAARAQILEDPDTRACWELVLRGIEVGWIDVDETQELLDCLRGSRDFGVEELLFEPIGERLRVSFLGEKVFCSPAPLIRELDRLVASQSLWRR